MRHPILCVQLLLASAFAASLCAQPGEPFIPAADTTVVQRIKLDQARDASTLLRAAHEARPAELAPALALAQHYLDIALATPSARHLGYAQAVLRDWWSQPSPPLEVRKLRALIAQHRHDFASALEDLDSIVKQRPRDVAALLVRAGIYEARGEYARARADCERLALTVARLQSAVCLASVASLTGNASAAYRLLRRVMARISAEPATRQWAMTVLAEVAARAGLSMRAQQHYEAALRMPARSVYSLASYADFLLLAGHAQRVVALLRDEGGVDTLLIRRALARYQLDPRDTTDRDSAQRRLAALRLRGDSSHLLEQARLSAGVLLEPAQALDLALQSWQSERSPTAARFIVELATRLDAAERAQPVIQWIRTSGVHDAELAAFIADHTRLSSSPTLRTS